MLQVAPIALRWTGACRRSSSVEQELSEAFRAVECLRSGSSPTALLLEHSLDLGVGREACDMGVRPG